MGEENKKKPRRLTVKKILDDPEMLARLEREEGLTEEDFKNLPRPKVKGGTARFKHGQNIRAHAPKIMEKYQRKLVTAREVLEYLRENELANAANGMPLKEPNGIGDALGKDGLNLFPVSDGVDWYYNISILQQGEDQQDEDQQDEDQQDEDQQGEDQQDETL